MRVYGQLCESSRTRQMSRPGVERSRMITLTRLQAPISRFGDTAANAGIFALLSTLTWPVLVKTIAASLSSALFRMTLTPIDTLKTTQQTRGGVEGLKLLRKRIRDHGIGCLWWGAVATAGATFVGNCKSGSGPTLREIKLTSLMRYLTDPWFGVSRFHWYRVTPRN